MGGKGRKSREMKCVWGGKGAINRLLKLVWCNFLNSTLVVNITGKN